MMSVVAALARLPGEDPDRETAEVQAPCAAAGQKLAVRLAQEDAQVYGGACAVGGSFRQRQDPCAHAVEQDAFLAVARAGSHALRSTCLPDKMCSARDDQIIRLAHQAWARWCARQSA
jgi:hypothetical protein